MSATVIVGAQFGDEGKGKIVDELVTKRGFDLVIRYNGGANAGHTVIIDGKTFKLHQVPSGIFHPEVRCVIGNGAVVDPQQLVQELEGLTASGIDRSNFSLSANAHLVMPWHPLLDRAAEARRGKSAIGTTGRGIGPCYEDKAARRGIRVGELQGDHQQLLERVAALRDQKARDLSDIPSLLVLLPSVSDIMKSLGEAARRLDPHIHNTDALARRIYAQGGTILLEGAQGSMLDLEFGTYPNVSSSYATSAGACVGSGLPPKAIKEVLCIAKAYVTRVGGGPFPTELLDATGDKLRADGHEYGTTTGRPRRCGWFDAPLLAYTCELNGADGIVLTKLDVLSDFETIGFCTGYVDNDGIRYEKAVPGKLGECRPVYAQVAGWHTPIADCTSWDALPEKAKNYVEMVEAFCNTKVVAVATGPSRNSIIWR
jgi:adenylosuccinate synthase